MLEVRFLLRLNRLWHNPKKVSAVEEAAARKVGLKVTAEPMTVKVGLALLEMSPVDVTVIIIALVMLVIRVVMLAGKITGAVVVKALLPHTSLASVMMPVSLMIDLRKSVLRVCV
jgi:hypothetical protein